MADVFYNLHRYFMAYRGNGYCKHTVQEIKLTKKKKNGLRVGIGMTMPKLI